MMSTSLAGSRWSISISNTSIPANFLKSTALPSMTGLAASGPMGPSPQHRGTVADDADQVSTGREAKGIERIFDDRVARRGDARGVRQGQVALVAQLLGGGNRYFAGCRVFVVIECRLSSIFLHEVLRPVRGWRAYLPAGANVIRPVRLHLDSSCGVTKIGADTPAHRRDAPATCAHLRASNGETDGCGDCAAQGLSWPRISPGLCSWLCTFTYRSPALKLAYCSSVNVEPAGTDQTPSADFSSVMIGGPATPTAPR